ncbi:MAG: 6-bladed beta-propeller [Bacteroidales bacterium]|uniref:6-bladed beta-propeller n=1 Tax=Tenuifilum sp. TaxID=2760880 RepID=UPI001B402EA3|nr:6-bladed beta-propeller [Bacteroidales bacterium]MBP9028571.1 6-bladed beta-propeller [Bacteroidales bacterium]HQG73436.1 6-bladed beta-propeller [Tenuifilum sp.]
MKTKYLVLIALFIFSCKEQSDNAFEILNIETNLEITLKSSVFSNSVSYVSLKNKNKTVIGEISKMRILENKFVFLDKKLSKILIFDYKGELVGFSNNYGKGPLEVSEIVDFYIDTLNETIEVLDVAGYKILVYNKELEPIRKMRVKINGQRNFFKISDNHYLLFNDNSPFENKIYRTISLVDTLGNHINSYIDNSDLLYLFFAERNCFNEFEKKIIFNRSYSEDIFEFDTRTNYAKLKYRINFENFKFPDNVLKEYSKIIDKFPVSSDYLLKLIDIANSGKYAKGLGDLYENNKYLFFSYDLTSTPNKYYVVYDKFNKVLNNGLLINDLSPIADFGKPVCMQGNKLYTVLYNEDSDTYQIAIYDLKE